MQTDPQQIAGIIECLAHLCRHDPASLVEYLTGYLWEDSEREGIIVALATRKDAHLIPSPLFTPLFAEILQELDNAKNSALNLQIGIDARGEDETSQKPNAPELTAAQRERSAYTTAINLAHACVFNALYVLRHPDLPHFIVNRAKRNKDSP